MSSKTRGFSLIELMTAGALGIVLLTAAVTVLHQGIRVNSMMSERMEMQQNARVAVNLIARDLSWAGTGLPIGAIQLPGGTSAADSRFGCDGQGCYVANNIYSDRRLYGVRPADGTGPVVSGNATDMVTVTYRDLDAQLDTAPLASIAADGSQIQFDSTVASEASKLEVGDALAVCNVNGCATGVVTSLAGTTVELASGDPLGINQPGAEIGTVASLADPGPPEGVYPPSRAFRLQIVTYFVNPTNRRLMRQVNAHPPSPVAEDIEDLQFTYDVFDSSTSSTASGLADAGGMPNQIRKVNVVLRCRAHNKALLETDRQRFSLTTSVSIRNLTFRDRYK